MKERGVHEDILEYVDSFVGSISDCESAVKGKLADIYSNLRNRLMTERTNRPHVECAMRDIEEEDDVSYELLVLRETALEMISNWRFWKFYSKSSQLEKIRSEADDIVKKSLIKCRAHREFGDLFTNIQDSTTTWDRTGEEEYCIRTVLVNKTLLNPSIYKFRDNPKNVRKDSLDCEEIYKLVVDALYSEVKDTKNVSDCHLKAYKDNNYADFVLKAEVLSKLSLERNDKSKEKQNFINSMIDISYDTKNC